MIIIVGCQGTITLSMKKKRYINDIVKMIAPLGITRDIIRIKEQLKKLKNKNIKVRNIHLI